MFSIAEGFDAKRVYDETYFTGGVYRDYMQEGPNRRRLFEKKLTLIDKYLPHRGRLLDIGCAGGFFLRLANDIGYDGYGIEVSQYAARHAREVLGLKVFNGTLAEANHPNDFFDVITMWDVLEHLADFRSTLTECHRVIRAGGILVVETLNAHSLLAKVLGRKWHLFWPPYHLSYFTRETLRMALEKTGFTVLTIIPVQTYVRTLRGFRPIRYFGRPWLREALGRVFDDIVLVVSSKKNDEQNDYSVR
jgi:2-polyprenyl-3-methyl-5-hydroxy-6-metoxy-1,4-benzoquinol methylase